MLTAIYPPDESLFFENALASVSVHAAGYVRINWFTAPMNSCELREVYNHALILLQQTGLTRILTDHRMIVHLA